MAKKMVSTEALLQSELQELMDAEKQLVRALPKMVKAANDNELERALREHLEITRKQVERLSQVFRSMEIPGRSRPCKGMRGIVEEGSDMLGQGLAGALLDSAIIGAARRVEHYEMAAYESARSLAQQLGQRDALQALGETLREEIEADRKLANLAKGLSGARPARTEPRPQATEKSRPTTASSRKQRAARASSRTGLAAHPMVDHDEIRRWAEERGATPACVRGTGDSKDIGMIRLDFPGYSGQQSLQEISWDEWFDKFDESNLALVVQERTSRGQKSNFNKLVKRTGSEQRPRVRAAR